MSAVMGERRLYVAWRDPQTRRISPVGLLIQRGSESGTVFTFGYLKLAETLERFRPLPGFPDLHRRYDEPVLFPLFANRVMPRERPDFAEYIERLNLNVEADPFEVLARSAGARATDRIEVFPAPERDERGRVSCLFFARGIRHLDGAAEAVDQLHRGDVLRLVDDAANEVNPRALLLNAESSVSVGYAPDYLVDHIHELRQLNGADPEVVVEHVNGREAAPHLRLLCRLEAPWPSGYQAFSGPQFESIVALEIDPLGLVAG